MLKIPGHKEKANQNKMRFHLTLVRMVAIQNTNNKCLEGCREKEQLWSVGENANECNYSGKCYGGSSKN
jgi:hypothetical protein